MSENENEKPTPDIASLPPGEMFMASTGMILADRFDTMAVVQAQLAPTGAEYAVHLTFEGKINQSMERAEVIVALRPEAALALVDSLVVNLKSISSRVNEENK